MIQKAFFLSAALLLLIAIASAQDPMKVAPQAYKLEFENEWVKVTRVHYAPHEKIPAHDHTETGAAYVYLNDSGPVIFKHIGLEYGAITRAATKAGSFRVYKAVKEVHEVENPNDTPSDFLRVEFKTAPDTEHPLRGKFYRETYTAGENFEKVQFENAQVRITRLACGKAACDVSANATEPVLLVALSPVKLKAARGGLKEIAPGGTRWLGAGEKAEVKNDGGAPVEQLRIEFKTKPVKTK
ncbi:MAG TPA: hypothetical protein VFD58_22795 [Blastocatellia bacterium]|nr:hypothetical protein [Blastocatellia bacterium]